MPEYSIRGLKVVFPYEAYPLQVCYIPNHWMLAWMGMKALDLDLGVDADPTLYSTMLMEWTVPMAPLNDGVVFTAGGHVCFVNGLDG